MFVIEFIVRENKCQEQICLKCRVDWRNYDAKETQ